MILMLWACAGDVEAPADAPGDAVTTEAPASSEAVLPDEIACSHILVKYEGSAGSTGVTRSRDDALARIEGAAERITAGEDFRQVAARVSEDASGGRGGWLGVGDQKTWVPAFTEVAFALDIGAMSPPVETEFGFHLIRREPLDPISLKHIIVRHQDSPGAKKEEIRERTPEEARVIAEALHARIAAGEAFEDIAREASDGAYGPRGGDLGEFLKSQLEEDFDAQVDQLEPGELSEPFATDNGYHILLRYE